MVTMAETYGEEMVTMTYIMIRSCGETEIIAECYGKR